MPSYPIKRGDIFWLEFNTSQGAEMRGRRPVLIIQNDIGNSLADTVIVAAITSNLEKELPVHVRIGASESGLPKDSMVKLEHIYTVTKERFDRPRIGMLNEKIMIKIDKAIMYSLGIVTDLKQQYK